MTEYNNKNVMIENHLGQYTLPQIKALALKTRIIDKIEKWTGELIACFPEFQTEIKTYMPVLAHSQDRYVLESLFYADPDLSFCENKDHDGLGMKYQYHMNCVRVSRAFLKELFHHKSQLYRACLFLDKIIHEITHAAQDMQGVAPLRVSQMNLSNAVTAELMTEVDATVVGLHLQYELASDSLTKAPSWIKRTDLGFYNHLMRQCKVYHGKELSLSCQQSLADMTLMQLCLDYKEDLKQNDEWQETYFRQTVRHLLCRSIHSLTIDTEESETEKYLMNYYQQRYPLLPQIQKKLMTVLPIRPIEQAVLIGNSFPISEPIIYGTVHAVKIQLLSSQRKVDAYGIYRFIKEQNQR